MIQFFFHYLVQYLAYTPKFWWKPILFEKTYILTYALMNSEK